MSTKSTAIWTFLVLFLAITYWQYHTTHHNKGNVTACSPFIPRSFEPNKINTTLCYKGPIHYIQDLRVVLRPVWDFLGTIWAKISSFLDFIWKHFKDLLEWIWERIWEFLVFLKDFILAGLTLIWGLLCLVGDAISYTWQAYYDYAGKYATLGIVVAGSITITVVVLFLVCYFNPCGIKEKCGCDCSAQGTSQRKRQ